MFSCFSREELVLENFLPKAVLESNILKRKDLKKLILQNLSWFFEKKFFDKTSIQIEYLKCMNELLQFSGRIYFVNLLVSSSFSFFLLLFFENLFNFKIKLIKFRNKWKRRLLSSVPITVSPRLSISNLKL